MGSALRIAIAGSTALHAGLIAALAAGKTPLPPVRAGAPAPAPPTLSQPVPLAITLVTLPDTPAVVGPGSANAPPRVVPQETGPVLAASSERRPTAEHPGDTHPGGAPAETAPGKEARGERPSRPAPRTPSAAELARSATRRVLPIRPPPSHPLAMSAPPPLPRPHGMGRRLVDGHRPPPRMRDSGGGRKRAGDGVVSARVSEDGTIESLSDPPAVSVQGLGGNFDLTDALMRRVGMQPYEARHRLLMDRTRGQRMEMATNARSRRLRQSLYVTRRDLKKLWTRRDLSATRRRELIFQLWDECAERGPSEVVATSKAVRATIETFIRKELPQGGPHGYSPGELATLNARRSAAAVFAPYR